MTERAVKIFDAIQTASGIFVILSILGLAAIAWNHEARMPSEIPPAWFEAQVREVRQRVNDLEDNKLEMLQRKIAELEAKIRLLESQ